MFGMRETTLYQMHNGDGELIYVGLTFDPAIRFGEHRCKKPWWQDVATIKVQHFEDRVEARLAEREMIHKLRPIYNVAYRQPPIQVEPIPSSTKLADIEGECDRCGFEARVPDEIGGLCMRCETELVEAGELVL